MLYLLVEEKYRSYPWCQRCLSGLWEEVRKKRASVQQVEDIRKIPKSDASSAILLLGASEEWVQRQVRLAHSAELHPIVLSNRAPTPNGFPTSSVTMDIYASMRQAIDYLRSLGCSRLALYGCNPSATSDPWREDVFRDIVGPDARVFYYRESLAQTFSDFWKEHSLFDGVICANDYAALSLVRYLRQHGCNVPQRLRVIGYGDLFLSRFTVPAITSISDDYEHFGRAALSIYSMVEKEKTVSTVSILLHSRLQIRATTGNAPYVPAPAADWGTPELGNPFYGDGEIAEMAKLETLLQQCDATDLEAIRMLLAGKSYASIAQACYISDTAVKYRVRKMAGICGLDTRASLVQFLKRFF